MNSSLFAKALVLLAALAITFTPGCRRKAKNITPIPQGRTGGIENPGTSLADAATPVSDSSGGLTDSGRLSGSNLGNTGPAVPQNTNIGFAGGPLDRSQFNEDRARFASDTVIFDFDSSVIKTSEKSKVTAVADYLRSNGSAAVEVEGHCDERGTEEYNRSLGERRALAVREELALAGIDPKRVYSISYGEDRPAVDGHDESAWSRNRRGEFILLTPR